MRLVNLVKHEGDELSYMSVFKYETVSLLCFTESKRSAMNATPWPRR